MELDNLWNHLSQLRGSPELPAHLQPFVNALDKESLADLLEQAAQGRPGGSVLNQPDEEGGMLIDPQPGFVLRTYTFHQMKVFVNVVHHESVPCPHEKYLDTRSLGLDSDSLTGIRLPFSMGDLKEESDKQGRLCLTVDVCVNPKLVAEAQKDPVYQRCFSRVMLKALESKVDGQGFSLNFSQIPSENLQLTYPPISYKGTKVNGQYVVDYHRIRVKDPLIEEVPPQIEEVSPEPCPFLKFDLFFVGADGGETDGIQRILQWKRAKLKQRMGDFLSIPGEKLADSQSELRHLWKNAVALRVVVYLPGTPYDLASLQVYLSDMCVLVKYEEVSDLVVHFPGLVEDHQAQAVVRKDTMSLEIRVPTVTKFVEEDPTLYQDLLDQFF